MIGVLAINSLICYGYTEFVVWNARRQLPDYGGQYRGMSPVSNEKGWKASEQWKWMMNEGWRHNDPLYGPRPEGDVMPEIWNRGKEDIIVERKYYEDVGEDDDEE